MSVGNGKKLKKRKVIRALKGNYDVGVFFLTICTQNRMQVLSQIVGTGVLDGPSVELLPYGKIADKYINQINAFYDHLSIEAYVIMPNHIHLLLHIKSVENGPSGTPVPTVKNSAVSKFVSTFKRFCNKECGGNIWQSRSYDHIIRNRKDYEEHLKYIHENPVRWYFDELYSEDG